MQLDSLLSVVRDTPHYRALIETLRNGHRAPDQHLLRAARPFMIAALARDLNRALIIVTAQVERAYNIAEQLPVWLPNVPVLRFAEPSAIFYDRTPWATNTMRTRVSALAALCPPIGVEAGTPPVIVTSAYALMQRTLPPREFRVGSRVLKRSQQADPDKLLRSWLSLGYTPASIVTEPGTFSRRGGIIDIFPTAMLSPVRIEFFGDEIDSLRTFDPATQRSAETIDRVIITPAREAIPKYGGAVADRLAGWFATLPNPDDDVTSAQPDEADLRSETAFPLLDFYLPYLYSAPASLLDYAPDDALIVVEDWDALTDTVADLESQALSQRADKSAVQLPADMPLPYITWDDLQESISERKVLHLGGSEIPDDSDDPDQTVSERTEQGTLGDLFAPARRYGGQLRTFLESLQKVTRRDESAIVITRQALRIAKLWEQHSGLRVAPTDDLTEVPALGKVAFIEGAITEGWTLTPPAAAHTEDRNNVDPNGALLDDPPSEAVRHIHLITDAELFGWRRPEPRRRQLPRSGSPEALFADLQVGDYVVHSEYGVGRFAGLHKRLMQGAEREYFMIEFAGTDTLYVPIHQVDRLTRYVGPNDQAPALHRLGSSDWQRAKEAARMAAEEIAKELLELYALRAHVHGYAFQPDTPWQHELEASFPFIETEDQLSAIQAVKADMERPHPMDRLICGDVGYGKTEVALRAAFKAVMDGKQVAVLVPTTVLAQQHFGTFTQRMLPFPVRIEMLSRFRTHAEQQKILEQTAEGQIDILIGTHRLIQSDVVFKDLGLLVIDEEQRFGVTHKEKLKRMRTEVDVLTMTATPIPRTLYMGLTGVRDLSLIQTPPEERLPVLTHVGAMDDKVVRQSILRELDRGGQVFYLHNRVSTIDTIAQRLRDLVPEAKIVIGHGQMADEQLEDVMTAFARGDYDVLLCTTIIESGLDIPNANTIIIDRADMFGLAQLYQLRGRVGRGTNRAYAYFFHPRHNRLNEDARARLQTIAEQTELGVGMSIAMRDLEIRGAGDMLGLRQSGYIASVGFHLYTQLLAQAVQRLKNGQPMPANITSAPSIAIDVPINAFVPTNFISDMNLRMQLYRRLADIQNETQLDAMRSELIDRFGTLPPELEGLLFQLRIKLLAHLANVTAITSDDTQISIRLPYLAEVDRAALQHYIGNGVRVSRTSVWLPRDANQEDWQARLIRVLGKLALHTPEAAA